MEPLFYEYLLAKAKRQCNVNGQIKGFVILDRNDWNQEVKHITLQNDLQTWQEMDL